MTTATQTNGKPTCTQPQKRGFKVCCLACGEQGGVRIYLDDMAGLFQCNECEAEFTPEEIRERIAGWEAVLAWVESAPAIEE